MEAVNFTNNGVVGFHPQFLEMFPQLAPDRSTRYAPHGTPLLPTFIPTGTKGVYVTSEFDLLLQRDLFDLVSVDVSNFQWAPGGSVRFVHGPSTLQLIADAVPVPYTRGTPSNGWTSISSPGNLPTDPGGIKFETVQLADSTDPSFPAERFRGIRSAFIGFDNVRGIDNVKLRWSRENFNVPATVRILEQESSGPGIVSEGTAVFHRLPPIELSGSDQPVTITSTERRVFSWEEDPLSTELLYSARSR